MLGDAFTEYLKPLASRMPRAVREHEVLRVAASLSDEDSASAVESARKEILKWTQKRCGGKLPEEAWEFGSFQYLSGGRNSVGIRIVNKTTDIWAIRADDPDKTVAGRVWTHEIVIGYMPGTEPKVSVRQLISTPEVDAKFSPHSPGFVHQITEQCRLSEPTRDFSVDPWHIASDEDAKRLIDILVDQKRQLPVFVLTIPDDDGTEPLLDSEQLAKATLGTAHVVMLPNEHTWRLIECFGRQRSVFGGAVRAYLRGFNPQSNPYEHRLVIADLIRVQGGAQQSMRWLRSLAAQESLRRTRLGRDVLSFSSVRKAELSSAAVALEESGAEDSEKLKTASAQIKALEENLAVAEVWEQKLSDEHAKAESRAEAAEEQLRAANFRIQALIEQLKGQRGNKESEEARPPETWGDLIGWCDSTLAGQLSLAPAARKGIKNAEFEDVKLVARCLHWLATVCREKRISGDGSLREVIVEDGGIRNSLCGGDEYDVDWQGRRYTADWHIKNGGNTRNPKRCLRIYYFWEPNSQQIVVTDMPAHRRTRIS